MTIPSTLDAWTYELVKELCGLGQVETDRHDFKFRLPPGETLTKICCAFANSNGGFIVLGVKDRSGHFIVEGTDPNGEIANEFGQKLRAVPTIHFETPKLIHISGSPSVLYVFHVPRSENRPHIPADSSKRVFWKRTNTGCEQMTIEEIRAQFMNYEERRERVKLLAIELFENQQQLSEISNVDEGRYSLITLDSAVLDRLLVDSYSVIQDDPDLIKLLFGLRRAIRICKVKSNIFYSQMQMAPYLADEGQAQALTANHNKFMTEKASVLIPLIDRALRIIEERFGFRILVE